MPVSSASCYLELAAELTSRFVGITPESLDQQMQQALRRINEFFSGDYCAIYQSFVNENDGALVQVMDTGRKTLPTTRLYGGNPAPQIFRDVLRKKQSLRLRTSDDFPAGAEADRARLAYCGIKSLLLIPVSTVVSTDYLFMLASVHNRQVWSKKEAAQVRLLAEMLIGALSQRCLQSALQHAKQDLATVQCLCGLGKWEWEVESGRIVSLEMVDQILGARPETQSAFMEFVYESDRQHLQKAINDVLSNGENCSTVEYSVRSSRGDSRIISSRFEAVRCGGNLHMTGSFHDVTDSRRNEQELELLRSQYWHADRVAQTGVLVASLAHELSQPLTAILGNAQAGLRFLSQEPLDRKEIHDILQDIVDDNRRARNIIDALRAMIRKKNTGHVKFDVADIAREVLVLLHSELVSQQVEVELACEKRCAVQADKAQIAQVLLNMMLNSIDSMRSMPSAMRRIRLQVKRADGPLGDREVQVAVSDTGVGIPNDQLGNVFEAFWTTKAEGLGMGLAVCRSIIEAHGGRIWAESNDGCGATFRFSLPLAN
jgi:signal transduction histidine kinase